MAAMTARTRSVFRFCRGVPPAELPGPHVLAGLHSGTRFELLGCLDFAAHARTRRPLRNSATLVRLPSAPACSMTQARPSRPYSRAVCSAVPWLMQVGLRFAETATGPLAG